MKLTSKAVAAMLTGSLLTACADDAAESVGKIGFGAPCADAVAQLGTPQATSTFAVLGLPIIKARFVYLTATKKVTLDCVVGRVFAKTVESHFSSTEKP